METIRSMTNSKFNRIFRVEPQNEALRAKLHEQSLKHTVSIVKRTMLRSDASVDLVLHDQEGSIFTGRQCSLTSYAKTWEAQPTTHRLDHALADVLWKISHNAVLYSNLYPIFDQEMKKPFYFEEFCGHREGLLLLTVRFDTQDECQAFVLPDWLPQWIEVTNDSKYDIRNLINATVLPPLHRLAPA